MRFLLFFIFLGFLPKGYARHQEGMEITDPYSNAMGNISICSNHIENPSLPATNNKKQIFLSYKNHYLTNELNCWKLSYCSPASYFSYKTGIARYGYEHYNRFEIECSLSKKLSSVLSLGTEICIHSIYYTGCENRGNTISACLGIAFTFSESFLVTFWANNPFQAGFYNSYNEKEKLPINIYGGFQLFLAEGIKWCAEIENLNFSIWKIKNGFEYQTGLFALRCGVSTQPLIPTIGTSFSFSDLSLELSCQYHNQLGYSICCGLKWILKNK